jgi:hypothetical protein
MKSGWTRKNIFIRNAVYIIWAIIMARYIHVYIMTNDRLTSFPAPDISISYSHLLLHIQLKLNICICQRNAQVKFEFGHGSMIFGRVMSLLL